MKQLTLEEVMVAEWDCDLSFTSALGCSAFEIGPLGETVAIIPLGIRDHERQRKLALFLSVAPLMYQALRHLIDEADDADNAKDSDLVACINWEWIRDILKLIEGEEK